MAHEDNADVGAALLTLVPEDGSSIGNAELRGLMALRLDRNVDETEYFTVQQALVEQGVLVKGRDRGGSVQRALANACEALTLDMQAIPEDAKRPRPKQAGLPLPNRKPGEAKRTKRRPPSEGKVLAYRHDERRINNPEVGLVTPDDDADERETVYAWDPHIDPALQFDIGRHDIETLIDDALASGDQASMHEALAQKGWSAPSLPSVRTISNLLNRQDYRLRTVTKTRVQKKQPKPTPSLTTSGG